MNAPRGRSTQLRQHGFFKGFHLLYISGAQHLNPVRICDHRSA